MNEPEWRDDYEYLRDRVIDLFNPPDDDAAEVAIMEDAIERAAAYIEAHPCTCPPGAADFDDDSCARCQALGRAADSVVPR